MLVSWKAGGLLVVAPIAVPKVNTTVMVAYVIEELFPVRPFKTDVANHSNAAITLVQQRITTVKGRLLLSSSITISVGLLSITRSNLTASLSAQYATGSETS